ncbi:MAG TPA: hypothetical protein VFL65_00915 [Jatrophihabitans sp.]|nr:hypothetical protein [Jatrophihabitans sp.]
MSGARHGSTGLSRALVDVDIDVDDYAFVAAAPETTADLTTARQTHSHADVSASQRSTCASL